MTSAWGLASISLIAIALAVLVAFRPRLAHRRGGKVLAFLGLFVLPILVAGLGTNHHIEHAKTTEFCLSCHEMEPYGQTLRLDDNDYLPAAHFQNHRILPEGACYTCHTDYTMFGGFNSKMRGLRHVWVHYVGPVPEKLALYEPYQNRECLHCHGGARSFEESDLHSEIRGELETNETSCLDCHDLVHPVEELDQLERWNGTPETL